MISFFYPELTQNIRKGIYMGLLDILPMVYNRDYSGQYNTELSGGMEEAFRRWVAELSQLRGRDASGDVYDYDMRGAFNGGAGVTGGHFTDTYKKPNHPTFSNQSQYNLAPIIVGGRWSKSPIPGPVSVDVFTPSRFNRDMWSEDELRRYFGLAEPNAELDYQGKP